MEKAKAVRSAEFRVRKRQKRRCTMEKTVISIFEVSNNPI